MSASTETSDEGVPEKGLPGVDSSMYRPYSGWNVGIDALDTCVGIEANHTRTSETYHSEGLNFSRAGSRVTLFSFLRISV